MKKEHILIGYMLIGFGIYFLVKQLNLTVFDNFYSWITILIIIGIAFLLHSYTVKEYSSILPGIIIFGIGVNLHGLENYEFWFDHWSVYPFIVGLAFIVRFLKTKSGLFTGISLITFSLFIMYSLQVPLSIKWFNEAIKLGETFWPVVLILIGLFLFKPSK